ncbi:Hypothetical protein, putative [Bodo saltans]|uniref:Uncharacterized protein n=1 Tax=Bodo saltans TaxID=75058 RepID=A0A0S4J0E1_BODSA|nr:Hypothetical protein, putative [Bodo saltans]|eukprot:CUF97316.1 Hypothetical protein, putative [Bodo saltans]
MTSTVLPAEHRRLRHVLQFACRHAPVLHTGSASNRRSTSANAATQAHTQYTLRQIGRDGAPGELLYESEVQSGTVHPQWTALPTTLTLEDHPNIRSLVFSLYRVAASALDITSRHQSQHRRHPPRNDGAKEDPSVVEPRGPTPQAAPQPNSTMSPTTQDGTATDTEMEDGVCSPPEDGEIAASEELVVDGETPLDLMEGDRRPREPSLGELTTEATILMVRRDSVASSGGGTTQMSASNNTHQQAMASAVQVAGASPTIVDEPPSQRVNAAHDNLTAASGLQEDDDGAAQQHNKQLIFECLIDLTKTEFLAKHFTGLHDIGSLPAHMDDGHRSFTILLRCHDGIFSPTMDASIADANANLLDLKRPTPSMYGFLGAAGGRGQQPQVGSTFLQHNQLLESEWDLVDGDAAREAEARQQKTESMTLGDVKALGSASIALQRMLVALRSCSDERRHFIDEALSHEQGAAVVAVRNAVTSVTSATCGSLIAARRTQIQTVEQEIAARRAALEARKQAIATARAAVLASVAGGAPIEESVVERLPLSSTSSECNERLINTRRRLAGEVVAWFQVNPAANTILGVKLPPNDGLPDVLEHAISIAHVAHAVSVYARVFNVSLPHPVHFTAPGRCRIYERHGVAPDKYFPLYPVKNSDRGSLRRGMDLLRQNIVSAAYSIHNQRQAEGLPLALATEKLLVGR